jgi:hypothetical protein
MAATMPAAVEDQIFNDSTAAADDQEHHQQPASAA